MIYKNINLQQLNSFKKLLDTLYKLKVVDGLCFSLEEAPLTERGKPCFYSLVECNSYPDNKSGIMFFSFLKQNIDILTANHD